MFVYVVKEDSTVTVRPIKAGPTEGDRVAVEAGVQPGERVVVDGLDRLREGAKVELAQRPDFNLNTEESKKGRSKKGP
jgi:multidrug efflux system membrane fusion protein